MTLALVYALFSLKVNQMNTNVKDVVPMNTPAVKSSSGSFVALSTKDIEAGILSISKRGATLDRDIQLMGLQCLNHIEQHGDVTLLNRLFIALPKGLRKNAFAQWALAHGKVEVNKGDDKKVMPLSHAKGKKTDMDGAMSVSWYKFSPEKPLDEIIDVQKAFETLLKRLTKEGAKVDNPELVKTIQLVLHPELASEGENEGE